MWHTGFDFSSCPEWSACRNHPVYSLWRRASQNVSLMSETSSSAHTAVLLFIIYMQHTVPEAAMEYCSHAIFFTSLSVCRDGVRQHHSVTEWIYCQRLQ